MGYCPRPPKTREITAPIKMRRGARVVEWGGLENRCAFAGTVGSNPTPSANFLNKHMLNQ